MVVRNIEELFAQRDLLTVEINGTAVSAALCGYFNHYGKYPSHLKKMFVFLIVMAAPSNGLCAIPLHIGQLYLKEFQLVFTMFVAEQLTKMGLLSPCPGHFVSPGEMLFSAIH